MFVETKKKYGLLICTLTELLLIIIDLRYFKMHVRALAHVLRCVILICVNRVANVFKNNNLLLHLENLDDFNNLI